MCSKVVYRRVTSNQCWVDIAQPITKQKHLGYKKVTKTLRVQKGGANQKLSDNSQIATCDQKFGNQAQVKN